MSKLHVISTGRNAGKYITFCIDSVKRQTLQPDSHTVIDDMSDDDTVEHLNWVQMNNNLPYLNIIHNTERKYRLKNIYDHAIDKDPEDIICIVDA
jgi:glycosyltransferase involved in cell wall biosynthesis